MEIAELTPAERRVRDAFPLGEGVDFRQDRDEDPEQGGSWGPERTLRAEVLRELLLDGPVREGRIAGLKVTGARITGRLDLKYGTVGHPVRLRSCHFEEAPDLYGAQVGALVLSDSALRGCPGRSSGPLHGRGLPRPPRDLTPSPVRRGGRRAGGVTGCGTGP
ncbi:hypothetical protein [Streptomyces cyanogenus]|uniref:Uncharacterized protein n=1 Tax=Streptomyces cyanogenus TaxID=80860 RepID=A0ABX7TRY3_STRCY|nr:hypothetical protein S1361_13570 [Streptomyces cyanogenus]